MAKLTKGQKAMLKAIETRLIALTTPASPCGVKPEHKEAVKLYVESWILQPVQELLSENLSRESIQFAERVPKPENWVTAYGQHTLDRCAKEG